MQSGLFFLFLGYYPSTGPIAVQTFDDRTDPLKKVRDEKVFSPAASALQFFLQLSFPPYKVTYTVDTRVRNCNAFLYVCSAG
jgi:hypothetical protein